MNRSPASDVLAEIRSRPAYHLACIWLENNATLAGGPRLAEKRIDLDWLARALREFTGATFAHDTLMVALTDRGYDVINTRRGLRVNMDERLVVDALGQRLHRSFAAYSDPYQKH